MALPSTPATSWMQSLDLPSKLFETGREDYELYEEDGEFVLTVEMPGFDRSDISLTWDDGVLNIAAQHEDEQRGRKKTYHRRFRFPKSVEDEDIAAEYRNGVLEVTLPVLDQATAHGTEIPIEG